MTSLKEDIKEIVEILALVPEPQKALCFELLLKEALASRRTSTAQPPEPPKPASHEPKALADAAPLANTTGSNNGTQPKVNAGADIVASDLHMKTKKFLEKGDVTLVQLNELFYKDGDKFESLSVDLKVTKMSEAQMRVALLQALQNSLDSGDFQTTVEAVREECKARKTYDQANFAANFKSSAYLFDFETWSRDVTDLRLSEDGKKELAAVVKIIS